MGHRQDREQWNDRCAGLIRKVLQASAAIPGIYPPVLIRARVGDNKIEEMHVDGAASKQFFLPVDAIAASGLSERPDHVHLWLIVNNTLPPEFEMTSNSTLSVAYRSLSTLIKSHTGDNARLAYEAARRERYDFNIAFIDRSVAYNPEKPFDNSYVETVFNLGERQSSTGAVWRKNVDAVKLLRAMDSSLAGDGLIPTALMIDRCEPMLAARSR